MNIKILSPMDRLQAIPLFILIATFMNKYHSTVQPKNNASARSGARSSCAARTRNRQKEVKLRFIRKKFQMQETPIKLLSNSYP